MLKNYIIIAIRNILKHKIFSFINIFGLALGISSCALILHYANYELSYDKFYANSDNIFRIKLDQYKNGELNFSAPRCENVLGGILKNEHPEVLNYCRIINNSFNQFKYKENAFSESNSYYADTSIFSMFSIPFIKGDNHEVLQKPFTTVISESLAKKYFGNENPIGKHLFQYPGYEYEIEGVFKDFHQNTHFRADIILSFYKSQRNLPPPMFIPWLETTFYTYLKLNKETVPASMEEKIAETVENHIGEKLRKSNTKNHYSLQPLTDIHLSSNTTSELRKNNSYQKVYGLLSIGILVLIMAWINYINLSTAKATERVKEVGMRKTNGARKSQIIKQFLLESVLINSIAVTISLTLIQLIMPVYSQISGINFTSSIIYTRNFWIILTGIFITGIIFSGFYPAFILSRFNPIQIFSNSIPGNKKNILRKTLLLFQFCTTIILMVIICTMYKQMQYIINSKPGFDIEQTLIVKMPRNIRKNSSRINNIAAFEDEIKKHSAIQSITQSLNIPGMTPGENKTFLRSAGSEKERIVSAGWVDHNFVKAYGLQLVAGKDFTKDNIPEQNSLIINEAALDIYGFANAKEAIGEIITFVQMQDINCEIVGVIKNFNQESLKSSHAPYILLCNNKLCLGYYSIKLNTEHCKDVISYIQHKFEKTFINFPFDYFFLDENYNKQYQADQKFGKLLFLFTLLSLLIASMGMYGLIILSTTQRTKEIGIRKVMGIPKHTIILILGKSYYNLIAIAALIGWPISYIIINKWLQNYANRITIDWWFYIIPFITILLISTITIGFHIIRTTNSNPIEALRYE